MSVPTHPVRSTTEPSATPKSRADGVLVVANPYSGARENRVRVAGLEAALRSRGLCPRLVWQLDEFDALVAAPDWATQYRAVVAAGGDGTLNRVVNHLPSGPLAVLPLGNENLFARKFGYTSDPERVADAVAAGRMRTIDLGRAGGRLFTIVASAGFDGEVAHRLATWRQRETHLRRVGSHSYVRPILGSLARYGYPMIQLETDGTNLEAALVMVFNLSAYCIGLRICPQAVGDDGLLDWIAFKRPGRVRLGIYALAALLRQHQRLGDVVVGRASRLRLRTAVPVPLEIDGEAAGFSPLEIEAVPGALRVIVPPDAC